MDSLQFNSQAGQDKFVLNILDFKKNGYFLEIGSWEPQQINNTFILEKEFNWKGIMIEYEPQFYTKYIKHRPNSIPIIADATLINYTHLFQHYNVPKNLDYLQIDLDVKNSSTLRTLQKLDKEVMDKYKFATITFEHDICKGDFFDTRKLSREIFKKRGYVLVFEDIDCKDGQWPFEDWYVHPDLVDINYIEKLQSKNNKNYISHTPSNKYWNIKLDDKIITWSEIEY